MIRLTWFACLMMLTGSASTASAGWPFFAKDGIRRGTPEYYEARAAEPPGVRQTCHHGKLWPPFPRPVGPHQTLVHRFHDAHYWPHPYVCQDRDYVMAVAQTQIYNGWQSATTLFDYHFHPASHELNSAGKAHLHWILSHAPEQFRQAHVAMADDADFNSVRLISVEREVAKMAADQRSIPVMLRVTDPVGRPASEVRWIFQQAQENMLPPVIDYIGAGTSAGGAPGQ